MSGHDERLRNDPENIVEALISLLDQCDESGAQILARMALPGSPTLILGAEPEDFEDDDGPESPVGDGVTEAEHLERLQRQRDQALAEVERLKAENADLRRGRKAPSEPQEGAKEALDRWRQSSRTPESWADRQSAPGDDDD